MMPFWTNNIKNLEKWWHWVSDWFCIYNRSGSKQCACLLKSNVLPGNQSSGVISTQEAQDIERERKKSISQNMTSIYLNAFLFVKLLKSTNKRQQINK